ncbi:MAG: hypothetical protein ACI9ON_000038 [Limisphaerales bacterium]|jgi:DNA-binding response OmpR family regulator
MVTGNADFDNATVSRLGIRAVFQKPLNSEQLLAKIKALTFSV